MSVRLLPHMSDHDPLISAYLTNCEVCPRAHLVETYARYNPEAGWRLMQALLECGADGAAAAGDVLRLLLWLHEDLLFDRAITAATADPRVARALGPTRIMPLSLSRPHWDQINRLVGEPLLSPDHFDRCHYTPPSDPSRLFEGAFRSEAQREAAMPALAAALAHDPRTPRNDAERRIAAAVPTDEELRELVEARLVHDSTFWASERVDSLVQAEPPVPEVAWPLVCSIVAAASNESVLGLIGAGPLEDFLSAFGTDWIDIVEAEAQRLPNLRVALQSVWQAEMSDDTYVRVLRAAGASGSLNGAT